MAVAEQFENDSPGLADDERLLEQVDHLLIGQPRQRCYRRRKEGETGQRRGFSGEADGGSHGRDALLLAVKGPSGEHHRRWPC